MSNPVNSDYKQVAEEAVALVERLLKINGFLRASIDLLNKKASASDLYILSTVSDLVKCGCLNLKDAVLASLLLRSDSNASFRVIKGLCADITNAKQLSKLANYDLHYGQLVNLHMNNPNKILDLWEAVRRVLASR